MDERLKYVGDDFWTHLSELEQIAKDNYPDVYNAFKPNEGGQFLMDIVAHGLSGIAFVQNRKVANQFLEDTSSKNIILKYANMFNYKPYNGSGAVVELNAVLDSAKSFPVKVFPDDELIGPDNNIYYVIGSEPITYEVGETEKVITVKQGRLARKFFSSDGSSNQKFMLTGLEDGEYIEPSSIVLIVDGVQWTEYDFLPFQSVEAYQADIYKDVPEIKFGNGIIGLIPPENANIEVYYRVHKGEESRVGADAIEQFRNPIAVQGEVINFSLTNGVSTGGFNPELLESVRVNSHQFHSTQDRAVTTNDYNVLAKRQDEVVTAHTNTPRSIENEFIIKGYLASLRALSAPLANSEDFNEVIDNFESYLDSVISDTSKSNTVMVYCLSVDANNRYASPSTLGMETLQSELQAKADAVHTVRVVSGLDNVIPVNLRVDVALSINADDVKTLQEINNALTKNTDESESGGTGFGILIRREAGANLFLRDLYKRVEDAISSPENVISINIEILSPLEYLDTKGNLIVPSNKIIFEAGDIDVRRVSNSTTR